MSWFQSQASKLMKMCWVYFSEATWNTEHVAIRGQELDFFERTNSRPQTR
jgi:hypothetical protein